MNRVTWVWILFAIMIVIFLGIGVWAQRRVKNEDDYATARNSYSWWIISLVLCATYCSGATFMGSTGLMYSFGFPVIWYCVLNTYGGYLGCAYLGKLGAATNNTNTRTLPELLGVRFNSSAVRVLGALISLFYLFSIGSQVSAGGTVFNVLLGIDYKLGVILTTAIVLAYLVVGGAHSNIMTAAVQCCIMIITAVICIVFMLNFDIEGGISGLSQRLTAIDPNMGGNSLFNPANQLYLNGLTVAMVFFSHFTVMAQPNYTMKFGALKKRQDMWKTVILSGVIGIICALGPSLTGLIARDVLPDLPLADMALVTLLVGRVPDFVYAFIVVGILCAILSTGSGLYLAIAQSISNDIYRCTLAPKMGHTPEQTERNVKWITRVFIIVFAVIAALIVFEPPPYLTLLLWVGSGGLTCTLNGALVLGLVWRGVSTKAVLTTMSICLVVYLYLITFGGWNTMVAAGMLFICNLVGTTILSLVFKDRVSDRYLYEHGLFRNKIKLTAEELK